MDKLKRYRKYCTIGIVISVLLIILFCASSYIFESHMFLILILLPAIFIMLFGIAIYLFTRAINGK